MLVVANQVAKGHQKSKQTSKFKQFFLLHVGLGMTQKQDGSYTQSQRDYLCWIKTSFTHQLCVDDERLYINLQHCQDRLKTCLIMQYGISKAV